MSNLLTFITNSNRRLPLINLLMAFMIIFATKLFWFDLRVIFRPLLFRDNIFWFFLTYALTLTPFIALFLLLGIRRAFRDPIILAFGALNVYGLVLGLIMGNSIQLILQDCFKLMLLPAGYLAYQETALRLNLGKLLNTLAWCMTSLQVLRVMLFLSPLAEKLLFGGVLDLFPFCVFYSRFLRSNKSFPSYWALAAMASLLLVGIGQKRTIIICLMGIIGFMPLLRGIDLRGLYRASLMAALLVVVALTPHTSRFDFSVFEDMLIAIKAKQAITKPTHDEKQPKLQLSAARAQRLENETIRLREYKDAFNTLGQNGGWAYFTGLGSGAVFRSWKQEHTGEEMHHTIHLSPLAGWYRYGVFGVLIFVALFILPWRLPSRSHRGLLPSSDIWAMKCYLIASLVSSLAIYGVYDDLFFGVFLSALVNPSNRQAAN